MPEPEHANRPLAAFDGPPKLPLTGRLLFTIGVHVTADADHVIGHVFSHLHRHARVFEANNRNVARQIRHAYQRIHASAEVEHGLQLRLFIEQRSWWMPDDGVIGTATRIVRLPDVDIGVWQLLLNQAGPALGFGIGGDEEDFHAHSVLFLGRHLQRAKRTAISHRHAHWLPAGATTQARSVWRRCPAQPIAGASFRWQPLTACASGRRPGRVPESHKPSSGSRGR